MYAYEKAAGKDKKQKTQTKKAGTLAPAQGFGPPRLWNARGNTIQLLRKRVSGHGAVINGEDILYDKHDGGYYKGMTVEPDTQGAVDDGELAEYRRISGKDRSAHTLLLAKLSGSTKYIEMGRNPVAGNSVDHKTTCTGNVYSGGIVMAEPPVALRLYAEGNFDHASILAGRVAREKDYEKLLELDGEERSKTSERPVVIKGTEYDTRAGVRDRYRDKVWQYRWDGSRYPRNSWTNLWNYDENKYNNPAFYDYTFGYRDGKEDGRQGVPQRLRQLQQGMPTRDRYYNEGYQHGYQDGTRGWFTNIDRKLATAESRTNLEMSFGTNNPGGTGDLARASHGDHPRQYDLIQTTFFWIPRVPSSVVETSLKDFLRNQYNKLKENGVARIILSYRDAAPYDHPDWNLYKTTADHIAALDQDEEFKYKYKIRKFLTGTGRADHKAYADRLTDQGLNDESFQHTRTDTSEIVRPGPDGDAVIEARKLSDLDAAGARISDLIAGWE